MNQVKHNFGISFSLDGLALAHSVTEAERLILKDFWVSTNVVSIDLLLAQITEIIQKCDSTQNHKIYFYCNNLLIQERLKNWVDTNLDPLAVRILSPIAPPTDSVIYLVSLFNDGEVAASEDIDLQSVKNALRGISEDEEGAIGTPPALSLLYALGEVAYRQLHHLEPQIFDRVKAVKMEG